MNNMLKAITASLLMEQVLAPNFKFKTKHSLRGQVWPRRAQDQGLQGADAPRG